ncbi:RNA 2',3'-cyclic phosphodiesterase [Paenibacillus physcomitrellae]|uniref:RNA 2',3'-cyclic phosphodiesterase n=1 Tax=Paenibacillus physcomitrellae TaxID=1619311 RepID=A0ABQ1GP51_9BACL|nr:RNA 2',3'-cyclic phosphodiesterase [Paenibacillus physcomitrellae]GGA47664.1 RNA 2',3'-cyclic phosphodiesterase [Paenibacillus physcomitrellae]
MKAEQPDGTRRTAGGQESWRVFVAVPLPDRIKQQLAAWCENQQSKLLFKKWVYHEDFHITVQFLGDIHPAKVPEIQHALSTAAAGIAPFRVKLAGTGIFGRPVQPRVLWAAVKEGREGLDRLHAAVTANLAPLGFIPEERPYSPHVTLARQFLSGQQEAEAGFQAEEAEFGSWEAASVVLYRTRMGRQPMYEVVAEAAFGGNGTHTDRHEPGTTEDIAGIDLN